MSDRPSFIITVDTEGDDEWSCPNPIRTENAKHLPRFQALCEEYGFKPTWLTNFEMAKSDDFVRFGRDVIRRGAGEIGMHLHAWSSPPLHALTQDDFKTHPYLIEYPIELMAAKIEFLTDLLQQQFGCKMISHRAGRWAFDARYAQLLVREGYLVDCSVTPHVSWRAMTGDPNGRGGSDYTNFPTSAYFLDLEDISRPGNSALLEVPPTIHRSLIDKLTPWVYKAKGIKRISSKLLPPRLTWLRPHGGNLQHMLACVKSAAKESREYIQFMIHSSELMPGGSQTFKDEESVDRMYSDLTTLFRAISQHFNGVTLKEYYEFRLGSAAVPESIAR